MNKTGLIAAMADITGATKTDMEKALDAFTTVVKENISKEDGVRLVGFGTFTISERKARVGRNPQTGAEIQIPARNVPVFKAGKELKSVC